MGRLYPEARCALDFSNPLELLVATILSAQCTDKRVNLVTPPLFKKYRTPEDYARADLMELMEQIKTTGFYRNKATSLKNMGKAIVERHGGKVPNSMEALVELPGVGRKTANVVLGNAFGIPGITVDTHMKRVSYRLGLTKNTDPEKIERDLMKIVPPKKWTEFSHQIITHGRLVCKAPKPLCSICGLEKLCPKVGVR